MGPKSSEPKHPASKKTKTVILPRISQEVTDEILGHLSARSDFKSLRSCALVSKSWFPPSRRLLFHRVFLTSRDTGRWVKAFPVPEEGPACHVRDLRFSFIGSDTVHEKFCEHAQWFSNVERLSLLGYGGRGLSWIPSLGRLPQSVTSLALNVDAVTLLEIHGVMVQLPNLDNLSLSGSPVAADKTELAGKGTVLRGRFGGQLQLLKGLANEHTMEMLLEIPSGVHFAEMQIRGTHECLFSTVRLAEACGETLVKLSYLVTSYCKSLPFFNWSRR